MEEKFEDEFDSLKYNICMDASQQSSSMPILPIFGSTRLTCFHKCPSNAEKWNPPKFIFPGKIIIKNAETINGCILQMRVSIADRKDSNGKPLFLNIKINCPNFEPTTAFVNGKQAKMSIQ
jgi:hypothetical protein